jgi:hypothetical protein
LPRSKGVSRSGRIDLSCAGRQVGDAGRGPVVAHDQLVAHIGARQHRGQMEGGGAQCFDILHRMHRKINHMLAQGGVEFARPQRLAADLGERAVEDAVAGCGHRDDVDGNAGMRGGQRGDGQMRLRHRQRRSARAKAQGCWVGHRCTPSLPCT